MNFLLGFVIFASLLHSQIALNNESINGRLMRISTNHETTSRDGRNTTNTRNDIVKDNRISGIGVDQSAILSIDPMRNLIVKKTIKSGKTNFFGFILIPYIICFFAAKGFWPFYPAMLQHQVHEMGKRIFSLSDDRVRQFCHGKFPFQETCHRPDDYATNCPTTCRPHTTSNPHTQSWERSSARSAGPHTTARQQTVKTTPQKNPDVEVFDSHHKPVITNKVATDPSPDNPKGETIEKLGDKEQPNINIEINNIFTFGGDNSLKNTTREV